MENKSYSWAGSTRIYCGDHVLHATRAGCDGLGDRSNVTNTSSGFLDNDDDDSLLINVRAWMLDETFIQLEPESESKSGFDGEITFTMKNFNYFRKYVGAMDVFSPSFVVGQSKLSLIVRETTSVNDDVTYLSLYLRKAYEGLEDFLGFFQITIARAVLW